VESMSAKWEEMFGERKDVISEKEKVAKKPRKKGVTKKPAAKKSIAKTTKSKPKATGRKTVKKPAKK